METKITKESVLFISGNNEHMPFYDSLFDDVADVEKENISNASFIGECFTVDSKTGLSYRKILEQRNYLYEALVELMEGVDGLPPLTAIQGALTEQYNKAEQAIKKATE